MWFFLIVIICYEWFGEREELVRIGDEGDLW